MTEHDATEAAYKNGYKQGRADAVREMAARMKSNVHGTNAEVVESVIAFIDHHEKKMLEEAPPE